MANGVPGIELRLPLLFSFGYRTGRLSLHEFVALTSTRHPQTYGLYPSDALQPLGRQVPEMAQLTAWNTPLQL